MNTNHNKVTIAGRSLKEWANFRNLAVVLEDVEITEEHKGWIYENAERIHHTIDLIVQTQLGEKCFAEIGPGGVGLAALQTFPDALLDAYDCVEWFKPLYDQFEVPWNYIDLNQECNLPRQRYNLILLCEVIEHVANWPVDVFINLKKALKPGGYLIVTTQNLHRLSNRLRMLRGSKLFADFLPNALVMGHIREYMPEEIELLMKHAGFKENETGFWSFPDLRKSFITQFAYRLVCKLFPGLSTHFYCMGMRPTH